MRMDIGTYQFNTGWTDANGTVFYISSWSGWDSPNLRQSTSDVTNKHASSVLRSYQGSRQISVQGVFRSPSEAAFWASYNGLLGYLADPNVVTTFDVYETVPKRLNVVRGGSIKIDLTGQCQGKFDIPLIAGDPLKYQLSVQATTILGGSQAVINNPGNWVAYPRLSTSATTVNVNVQELGMTFLADGITGTTVFDMAKRTAYRSLTNVFNSVNLTGDWIYLAPGNNTVRNQGSGPVSVEYYPAWM